MRRRAFLWFAILGLFPKWLANSAAITPADVDPSWAAYGARWGPFVETNFPFISSTLDARNVGRDLPHDNLTPRGLILQLSHQGWACFDVDLLRVSAVWVGKGVSAVSMAQISYHSPGTKISDGQNDLPKPLGEPWLANGIYPGWQAGAEFSLRDPRAPAPDPKEVGRGPLDPTTGRFRSIRLTGSGVSLEYEVAGVGVREGIEMRLENGERIFERRFRIQAPKKDLWLILGKLASGVQPTREWHLKIDRSESPSTVELRDLGDGVFGLRVKLSPKPVEFRVALTSLPPVADSVSHALVDVPANSRWPEVLKTRGTLAPATNAYVVDNVAIPLDNPWRRNIRLTDLGFRKDGSAAVVTFDGDVWMVSGLSGDLSQIRWRRFASGLNEPQSLCIRGEDIFVFDRNGIWRLMDRDRNGEADSHELFSNAFAQTAETREYAQAMKLGPDGSFIIGKGGIQTATLGKHNGTVIRVSPDGESIQVLGRGLRSPYLGVHPKTGLITASDQQGNYVPTTPVHIITSNQFYGFMSSLVPKEVYPEPIASPLLWIPYTVNASGANQTWLVGAQMGPLNDSLIHFGYYRPEIFQLLLNRRLPRWEGAVVSVARDLEFPPFDGVVNPRDGQLYFTGFQIWGSSARQICGLGRLRYTAQPSSLPREVVAMDKGVLLRFHVELDELQATNPANYSAERWSYKRTANYGSPHFKLDGTKGQEVMIPSSAYLSRDRKRVFVGIAEMKPVMQLRIGWALTSKAGLRLQQNAYLSPYELPQLNAADEGFGDLVVDLSPRTGPSDAAGPITVQEGKRVAELMGCLACHSNDGSMVGKVGPTWKGLFGHPVPLSDGSKILADESYLRESIKEPARKVVRGFDNSETGMPSYEGVLTESQIEALILYIKTL